MDRGNPPTTQNPGPGTAAGNDETKTVPSSGDTTTLYAAEQYSACTAGGGNPALATAVGLNYNWTNMTNLINGMGHNGSTNQAIGLQLGWMSLAGGGPFTVPAVDPNYTYQKYIILLTDGLNTQDRWYGNGSNQATQVDTRQQALCDNIKRDGIIIYAIQADTSGDGKSSVLQYCAGTQPGVGDPNGTNGYYIWLTNPNDIVTVFSNIGQQISKLHIAR
jgi:hypothetical protein